MEGVFVVVGWVAHRRRLFGKRIDRDCVHKSCAALRQAQDRRARNFPEVPTFSHRGKLVSTAPTIETICVRKCPKMSDLKIFVSAMCCRRALAQRGRALASHFCVADATRRGAGGSRQIKSSNSNSRRIACIGTGALVSRLLSIAVITAPVTMPSF